MKREYILILCGILVLLSPFYGFPELVMTGINVLLGLVICSIGYTRIKKESVTEVVSPPPYSPE